MVVPQTPFSLFDGLFQKLGDIALHEPNQADLLQVCLASKENPMRTPWVRKRQVQDLGIEEDRMHILRLFHTETAVASKTPANLSMAVVDGYGCLSRSGLFEIGLDNYYHHSPFCCA